MRGLAGRKTSHPVFLLFHAYFPDTGEQILAITSAIGHTAPMSKPDAQNSSHSPKHKPSMWADLGPVIAYVAVFNIARKMIDKQAEFNLLGLSVPGEDAPLYIGALVFAIAIILAVIHSKIKTGQVSIMLKVTAIIVLGTAAITIGFKSPTVFKMKPTAINLLFGLTILGSLAMGKNVFKLMFAQIYKLPEQAWRILAFRWGVFFLFLALLNEYIWRNYSVKFWTDFKLIGMLPITLVFAMLNMPLLMKHMPDAATRTKEE